MLQPLVRRTWAPRGQTPIQRAWDRRDRLSVLSGVTLAPRRERIGLYFDIHAHNITTDEVYRFVRSIRQRLRRGLIVVWDRWNVHRSAARRLQRRCPTTVQIEWLPAYAPDLNPTEQVWNHSKYCDLANFIPEDIGHLEYELLGSFDGIRCTPELLRSFFHTAELRL